MLSIMLNGKAVARKSEEELSTRVARLKAVANGAMPILAIILVGDDPASATYVKIKAAACERIGMRSLKVALPTNTTTEQLRNEITGLNKKPDVHSILLQHPVPSHIDERRCFDSIDVTKDVDGVTCLAFGRMAMNDEAYGSATPKGIRRLLAAYDIPREGTNTIVVGRSPILGEPMAMMLLNANPTVTICHSRTQGLPEIVKRADVVIGAVGRPELIKADWIKDGAVVVDAGYHPGGIGDIECAPLIYRVSAYTPVPGGGRPMTVNTLIYQCVEAAEKSCMAKFRGRAKHGRAHDFAEQYGAVSDSPTEYG